MFKGILCIDKPKGFTSFDVVAKMRGITRTRRIGHAGTLDPMATGVLPLFFGNATRAVDILPNQDKEYIATFRLGITTNTEDITGKTISVSDVTAKKEDVFKTLQLFLGEIFQIPPMFSAIQVGGKRLYDLARLGIEIEREKRKITIYEIELLPSEPKTNEYTIRVKCSKGTYIRTLCADIGKKLLCGATLVELRRTISSGFTLESCLSIEQAEELSKQGKLNLMPVENVFATYPEVVLSEAQSRRFGNGGALDINRIHKPNCNICRVLSVNGEFLGLGEVTLQELRVKKLFIGGITE
jgi:tRNA pseudouridine55 synthase